MVIAVVGRGLIGSGAARHLAEAGHEVMLIGPSEPDNKRTHAGVFASHYDEGRITRGLDPEAFWSTVSKAAITRYREIEKKSGVSFYHEVGLLMAGPRRGKHIQDVDRVAVENRIKAERYDDAAWRNAFHIFGSQSGHWVSLSPSPPDTSARVRWFGPKALPRRRPGRMWWMQRCSLCAILATA